MDPLKNSVSGATPGPMPTRAELESAEPGLIFRFEGLNEEADAERIATAAISLLDELAGRPGEGDPNADEDDDGGGALILHPLRLVVFTANLRDAVFHWQRELGRPEDLSDNDEGTAVGKALLWNPAQPAAPCAVVLLNVDVGYALASGHALARALFAHEVTHVHLGVVLGEVLGRGATENIGSGDWPAIRRHLAVNSFDEFFAEYTAARYADEEVTTLSLDLLVQVASGVRQRIRDRVAEYRHEGDHAALWGFTITEVSSLTNQLGRSLGLLYEQGLPDTIVEELESLSPRFVEHLRRMEAGFGDIMGLTYGELGPSTFAALEAVVEEVFGTMGVVPKWDGSRLGVDVPWWPGEQERAKAEHRAMAEERMRQAQAQVAETAATMRRALAALRK